MQGHSNYSQHDGNQINPNFLHVSRESTNVRYNFIKFNLIVRDFGYGIAPESLDKLFIDFSKLNDEMKVNKEGVGLGLSICKSLIQRMAGSVSVES